MSIIIPTKNEENVLEECLSSIFNQSVCPLEVIIVDGGSTDDTLYIAKRFDVKLVKEEGLSSPANARNLGAERAKGKILLMMDADTVLHNDCLRHALEIFVDKDVIAMLPSILNQDHSYLELIQRKWNEASRTPMTIGLRKSKTSGFVIFFRKEVFEKIRFNTTYGFGEDDDFSVRLEKEFKDRKILVAEDCKVISHSPHTIKELAARYMWWGRTFFAYAFRHFGLKSILNMGSLLLPVFVVLTLFIYLIFPQILPLFILLLSLFIVKITVICLRSRSSFFVQFTLFDLARSFFFVAGLAQSLFASKKGR